MAIGAIEFNGMVTRQQDFQNVKTAEDQKPIVDNTNYQNQVEKNVQDNTSQVHNKDEAQFSNDANQNKNEYSGDGGKNRNNARNQKNAKDGKIINKSVRSFDIKI